MASRRKVKAPVVDRQSTQERLVEEAEQTVGVADVLEHHKRFAPWTPRPGMPTTVVKHSTGANS